MKSVPPSLKPAASALERLPEEWGEWLAARGEAPYRANQLFQWLFARGVLDPELMTNLSKRLRAVLAEEGLALPVRVAQTQRSSDGTRKLALELGDGGRIETVLIPEMPDEDEPGPGRVTQCISTQVGCAMGCVFCASGLGGLKRHLTAAEIVGQVLLGRSALEPGERLTNVVMMGMGEPLHNYDAVARSLVLLSHPDGLDLSTRRVTVSTSGLVPEIDRLGREFDGRVQLAVSLHAVSDDKRSSIMPVNRKYPLATLVQALRRYPLPRRRRITIEYTLIRGVNDVLDDADKLVALLNEVPIKVNLIPMNPVKETTLAAPDWDGVYAFQDRLRSHGVPTFIRRQRGEGIDAACGQLALEGEPVRKRRLPPAPSGS